MNDHMIDMNLDAPGIWAMIAYVGTYLMWTGAYIMIIAHARKTRQVGMPLAAVSLMWAYETAFILFFEPPNKLWAAMEIPWWIFDTILMFQLFKYSEATSRIWLLREYPKLGGVAIALVTTVCVYNGVLYLGWDDGVLVALLVTAAVALHMAWFVQVVGIDAISLPGHIARALADACSVYALFQAYPFDPRVPAQPDGSYLNYFTVTVCAVMVGADLFLLGYMIIPRVLRWRWLRSGEDGVPPPDLRPFWPEPAHLYRGPAREPVEETAFSDPPAQELSAPRPDAARRRERWHRKHQASQRRCFGSDPPPPRRLRRVNA